MHFEHILTCDFVVTLEDIEQFNLASAADLAAFQELILKRKNIALCERHGDTMLDMIATRNITGYEETHTEVVELDDGGVLVTHSVKPTYQLH